jgi:hypothetical protein
MQPHEEPFRRRKMLLKEDLIRDSCDKLAELKPRRGESSHSFSLGQAGLGHRTATWRSAARKLRDQDVRASGQNKRSSANQTPEDMPEEE